MTDDCDSFLERFEKVLSETDTSCYAWSLMPNHFHFLLQTGSIPISTIMRRLLTGYALYFNKKHRRHGHLFQNRFKSILCQKDSYFLELVSNFVEQVLLSAEDAMERIYKLRAEGMDLDKLTTRVSKAFDVKAEEILSPGKFRRIVEARSVLCYWAVKELGISMTMLSGEIGISVAAVSGSVIRGQKIAEVKGLSIN